MYADEPYYKDCYLLGRKPAIISGFAFYARSASRIMDQYTFNRLEGIQGIPEAARMCCCELAEAIFRQEKQEKESGGKTSEKVGTYSVSFGAVRKLHIFYFFRQFSHLLRSSHLPGHIYIGVVRVIPSSLTRDQ